MGDGSELNGPAPTTSLVIAMATYRRPECLDRILPLLAQQRGSIGLDVEIVVVDNDPEGGARDQVDAWQANGVRYVHEPRPGIAAARNRALDESSSTDLLVFIDDDEIPTDGWLRSLVACWEGFGCAAVTGPVLPQFEGEVDPWVVATGVFERRSLATGTVIQGAATNNLLLDLRVLRRLGIRFDERFGITGGSDTMLTYQLVAADETIVWCDEAEVVDVIPAGRTTRQWVLRRTVRTSNAWMRVRLVLATSGWRRAVLRVEFAIRSVIRGVLGLGSWSVGAIARRPTMQAKGARDVARATGVLLATVGVTWSEYLRSPTRPRRSTAGTTERG